VFYNRTKGEVEQAVSQLGFKHLVIVRPSLLLGNRAALGQPPRLTESLAQWFAPALTWITPRRLQPVRAETVAKALLAVLANAPAGVRLVESDELHRLGS